MKRLLVDTNVFLYARCGDHPYRDACRQIVRDAVHAATGLEAGIHEVCSTDRVFDQLPVVTRADPATLAIEVGA